MTQANWSAGPSGTSWHEIILNSHGTRFEGEKGLVFFLYFLEERRDHSPYQGTPLTVGASFQGALGRVGLLPSHMPPFLPGKSACLELLSFYQCLCTLRAGQAPIVPSAAAYGRLWDFYHCWWGFHQMPLMAAFGPSELPIDDYSTWQLQTTVTDSYRWLQLTVRNEAIRKMVKSLHL